MYATAGLSGVRRFLVDEITNPQLDFDASPKMAFLRAVLYGDAGRLDEAFDCLDQAIAFRDPALVHLGVRTRSDNLCGDARFAERLRSCDMVVMRPTSPVRNSGSDQYNLVLSTDIARSASENDIGKRRGGDRNPQRVTEYHISFES